MTLVQILQKLRDDLLAWGTTNFEVVNANVKTLDDKITNLNSTNTSDLDNLRKEVEQNAADIDVLETKTEYIDASDSEALFITDKDENVVAYFDAAGLHVTDIEAKNLSLEEGITQNGEQFFIIDKDENVVAYINEQGTHVTNLYASGNGEFKGKVKASEIEVSTGIVQAGDDKFYIIDSQEQVAMYVDGNGTYTTNFHTSGDNNVGENLNVSKNASISGDLIAANIEANGNIKANQIETATGIVQDGDSFFIIDKNENVAMAVDNTGIHTTDLFVKNDANINGKLNSTSLNISDNVNIGNNLNVGNNIKTNGNIEADQIKINTGIIQNGNDTFYVIDNQERVATYIDNAGTHVTNLFVKKDAVIEGKVEVDSLHSSGNVLIDGDLSVAKDIEILGDFKATNIEATQKLKANEVEINTGITQNGNDTFFIIDSQDQVAAYIDGEGTHVTSLYADKNLEIAGNTTLKNILTVLGKTTLNDDLYVDKKTDTNTLNVRSASNLNGDLTVNANTELNGILNVEGQTTMSTLTVLDNVNVNGDINITGTFKSANLDATDNDSFFITDKDMNVIAYFNEGGLYITDVITKGIKFNGTTFEVAEVKNGALEYSVNEILVQLLNETADHSNTINNHEDRIDSIEETLKIVTNVMDFIGVFNTKEDLDAYETPNKGDVAVVVSNQSEYVYDGSNWIEFGYSSYTATALSKLQEVVGHTDGLNTGELDHHTQLVDLKESLNAEIDDRQNADRAINYLGDFDSPDEIHSPTRGDIAVINKTLKIYDGSLWQDFEGLSHKLYYIDGTASDKIFFIDGTPDENVVAYIDSTGVHTTNLYASTDLIVDKSAEIGEELRVNTSITTPVITTNVANIQNINNSVSVVNSNAENQNKWVDLTYDSINLVNSGEEYISTQLTAEEIQTPRIDVDKANISYIEDGTFINSTNEENFAKSIQLWYDGISVSDYELNKYTYIQSEMVQTPRIETQIAKITEIEDGTFINSSDEDSTKGIQLWYDGISISDYELNKYTYIQSDIIQTPRVEIQTAKITSIEDGVFVNSSDEDSTKGIQLWYDGISLSDYESNKFTFIQSDLIQTPGIETQTAKIAKIINGFTINEDDENSTTFAQLRYNNINFVDSDSSTNISANKITTPSLTIPSVLNANESAVTISKDTSISSKLTVNSLTTIGAVNSTNTNLIVNGNIEATGTFKSKYLDATNKDAFYFIDPDDNVGVYIDNAGLHAHTFEAQQIITRYKDSSEILHSTTNNMANIMYFDVEDEITVTF